MNHITLANYLAISPSTKPFSMSKKKVPIDMTTDNHDQSVTTSYQFAQAEN